MCHRIYETEYQGTFGLKLLMLYNGVLGVKPGVSIMRQTCPDRARNQSHRPTVCLITPPGEGGIGIVLLTGPGAEDLLARHFRGTSRRVEELEVGDLAYGHVERSSGRILDEVIVARTDDGEDAPRYEVNCHGGVAAVRAVMECLRAGGARRVDWRELAQEHTRPDRPLAPGSVRAAATARLPRVETRLGARVLLHQLNGALTEATRRLLDTGQRDGDAARGLERLLRYAPLGRALTDPPSVLLAGPPNVGKSTLLNALLQRERVIVHHQPGTTRDVVRETVSLEGVPFELMDSAGVRTETGEIEAQAIERVRKLFGECHVLVLVYDTRGTLEEALRDLPALPANCRVVIAGNKVDLLDKAPPRPNLPLSHPDATCVFLSAREGRGVEELEDALLAPYRHLLPDAEKGAAIPFTDTIASALEEVAELHRQDPARAGDRLRALMAED